MQLPKFNRILLIRWGLIGDVLFTTPVFKAIRERYPDAYLALVVSPGSYEIVSGNPLFDEIFVFDTKENSRFKNLIKQVDFVKTLRDRKFDLVIDLYNGGRSPFFAYLSGAKYRLGGMFNWKRLFFNLNYYTGDNKIKHCIEGELDKIRPLGIVDNIDKKMIMCISDKDREFVGKIDNIKSNKLLIGINPGAGCPSKRWKVERFAKVADVLMEKYNAKVIIIKNLGYEEKLAYEILSLMKGRPFIAPILNLKQLAALTEACTVFISGDTGPFHIAVAMGTSTVGLFTSTSPELARPLSGEHRVVYKNVRCDPCFKKNCKELKCVELITADEVINEVESILKVKKYD